MMAPFFFFFQVGTGHTVAKLADASELPGVTVAQVNYSTVTDGEVKKHPDYFSRSTKCKRRNELMFDAYFLCGCRVGGAELGSPRRRDDNPNHSGLGGHTGRRLPGRSRRRSEPRDSARRHSHNGSEQVRKFLHAHSQKNRNTKCLQDFDLVGNFDAADLKVLEPVQFITPGKKMPC